MVGRKGGDGAAAAMAANRRTSTYSLFAIRHSLEKNERKTINLGPSL